MVEMNIVGLAIDPSNRSPIILLRDTCGKRQVPIWINHEQAHNIMMGIEKSSAPTSSSHDLMISLINAGNLKIEKIIIHSIQEGTFKAILKLTCTKKSSSKEDFDEKNLIEVEARPSDAIALAIRSKSSIWMHEEVVSKASIPVDAEADELDQQEFKDFLDQISPTALIQHLNTREESNKKDIES